MARWVRFAWPSEFKGNPRELDQRAGLIARRDRVGDWRLTTAEQYGENTDAFLSMGPVAPTVEPNDLIEYSAGWEEPPDVGQRDHPNLEVALKRLLHAEDDSHPSLEEFWEAARLLFMTSTTGELNEWLSGGLAETLEAALPTSRLCGLKLSIKVHARLAWARAVFAIQHDEYSIGDGTSFQGFNAMRGLAGGGLQGSTSFLHPLLAAHAPWVYGVPAARPPNGLLVFLFDQVLPGRSALLHDEFLTSLTSNYLAGGSLIKAPATPQFTIAEAEAALRWWVVRLNGLLEVILDPTLFSVEGDYDSAQHLGYLFSIERLFSSVTASVVYSGMDEYTRRIHLFEALDVLEGFGVGNYDTTLNPRKLRQHLDSLKESIPDEAKPILLPRCEAAVTGLGRLGDGFHSARVHDGMVDTPTEDEPALTMSIDRAIPRYLRHIRNAGHSMGEELTKPRALALLASHDGVIPAEISDVAYLHLIRVLADPELLFRPLSARAT